MHTTTTPTAGGERQALDAIIAHLSGLPCWSDGSAIGVRTARHRETLVGTMLGGALFEDVAAALDKVVSLARLVSGAGSHLTAHGALWAARAVVLTSADTAATMAFVRTVVDVPDIFTWAALAAGDHTSEPGHFGDPDDAAIVAEIAPWIVRVLGYCHVTMDTDHHGLVVRAVSDLTGAVREQNLALLPPSWVAAAIATVKKDMLDALVADESLSRREANKFAPESTAWATGPECQTRAP